MKRYMSPSLILILALTVFSANAYALEFGLPLKDFPSYVEMSVQDLGLADTLLPLPDFNVGEKGFTCRVAPAMGIMGKHDSGLVRNGALLLIPSGNNATEESILFVVWAKVLLQTFMPTADAAELDDVITRCGVFSGQSGSYEKDDFVFTFNVQPGSVSLQIEPI